MGTVFRFVGRTALDEASVTEALQAAAEILHRADQVFSLYKQDSPLSRLARGETQVSECPPEVSEVWNLCGKWSEETSGWFSAFTPEHSFDPSGLVKSWTANSAAEKLEQLGLTDFAMNAGGDIRLSRNIQSGVPLRIGISKPITIASKDSGVLTVVDLNDTNFRAVATSGNAERGAHIWNPNDNSYAASLAQVTVVAQDLITADIWATALFASGAAALGLVEAQNQDKRDNQIAVLIVELDGSLIASEGFGSLLKPM